MDAVQIKPYTHYSEEQILTLYQSVGWSAYTADPEKLKRAFANSLCAYGAFIQEELVGLVRLVGDGVSVVFLQDILIKPAYQRQGIGTQLIAQVLRQYGHVRQMYLMTDDLPETAGFYQAVGFTPVEKLHIRAFSRLKY